LQSGTVQVCGCAKEGTRPVGVGLCKKPKDMSPSEREECEDGEGVCMYDTLLQSDTVQTRGFEKEDMRTVGDGSTKNQRT
jgi:hypothetical protein